MVVVAVVDMCRGYEHAAARAIMFFNGGEKCSEIAPGLPLALEDVYGIYSLLQ